MRRIGFLSLAALVMLVGQVNAQAPTTAPASEPEPAMVENPQFKACATFNVGSGQVMEVAMGEGDHAMKMSTKQTLVEKGDEELTVEVVATMEMGGQTRTMPAQKQKVPAKAPDQGIKELGHESVTAAGETFDTVVYQLEQKRMTMKAWFSDKVPGGIVKMSMTGSQGKLEGELKSYEVK